MPLINLEVKYVDIETIKPYKNNAKQHPKEQIEQIKKSIQEFGMIDPIGVWNNEIVEGHGRLIACQELGIKEVPIIRLDQLTDEQRRAYALVHNQLTLNSDNDPDIEAEELEKILDIDMSEYGFDINFDEEEQEIVEDEVPEVSEEPKSKLGDIYQLGNHRLMCGDSTSEEDVAKLMNRGMADLIITDPPYNVDYSSKNDMLNYSDKGSHVQTPIENDNIENFEEFIGEAYQNMSNNAKEGAVFYIWHSEKENVLFIQKLIEAGVYIHQTIIWVKNNFVLGRMDYQIKHEPCLYGWKKGNGHYFIDSRSKTSVIEDTKPDINKMKKEEMKKLLEEIYSDKKSTSVIRENKPQVSDLHPTMKPIKLLATLIQNSSRTGEMVMDLFGGSGSTLIACEQLNRKCYMMELDPHYIDVIIQRWENFTGKKAIKL